jgi:hypothetical protein
MEKSMKNMRSLKTLQFYNQINKNPDPQKHKKKTLCIHVKQEKKKEEEQTVHALIFPIFPIYHIFILKIPTK